MNKEDLIFALYKDKIITCKAFKNMCKNEYNIEDPQNLYVRINNYQIEKYGTQLCYEQEEDQQAFLQKHHKARLRERGKRKYYKDRRYKL